MITGFGLGIISSSFSVVAEAEVIRKKRNFFGVGDAQIDTAQSKYGGSSLYLDGSDYIEHTASGLINTANNGTLTIEMWVRPAATQAYNGLFDASPSLTGGIRQYGTSGNLVAKVQQEANGASTGTWTANTWTHFAVTFNNGTITTYRDGTQEDTGSYTGGIEDKGAFIIGGINRGSAGYFTGHIDEFRISNSIRYTGTFTPSTTPFTNDDNTKLLLHMNGTDGSTFFEDDNGVRAQSSLVGLGGADIDTAQSKFGGASFYVDGTGGDGVLAYLPSNPTAITVEGWYKFDGVPSSKSCMFAHNRASTGYGNGEWFVTYNYVLNDWSLNMKDNTGTTVTRINSTGTAFENTNWHHLAVCMEIGGYGRLFIDGTLQEEVDISGYTFTDWTGGLNRIWLGHWYSSANNHECYFDEFRISDNIRYTASFTAPTAPFTNDSNTIMLLHADGTNGSQVFRDDNGKGRSSVGVSASGNTQISDSNKFGGGSAFFDGTNDHLLVHSDFTFAGDFTWEGFARSNASGTIITNRSVTDTGFETGTITLERQSDDTLNCNLFDSDNITSSATSDNVWFHWAIVRDSGTITLYLDGVSQGTSSNTVEIGKLGHSNLQLGTLGNDVGDFNGRIDEVRVSNTARYTAGFTAPTEPFQNDANTLLLLHMDGTDGSTTFIDDNGTFTE